ncbi:MAG: hypothetical protein D6695_00860 [Planctomycetota bacterium]|nr:MAG: hypothetical protein D6695_00860 [Planctomycetota bacterium]
MSLLLLAYRPFLDPIPLDRHWYLLLIPMSFFLAVGYKSVRTVDMRKFWPQVFLFTAQLIIGLFGLGIGFYILVRVLLPALAPAPL